MPKHDKNHIELLKTWVLPPAATLGSSVRMKGILLEIRARLPHATKKSLNLDGRELTLMMPASEKAEFHAASAVVVKALVNIETLPVIPREIEDILTIKTSERHRWLADGRLPSAGTRTVKLRGRSQEDNISRLRPEDCRRHSRSRRRRRLARGNARLPPKIADGLRIRRS